MQPRNSHRRAEISKTNSPQDLPRSQRLSQQEDGKKQSSSAGAARATEPPKKSISVKPGLVAFRFSHPSAKGVFIAGTFNNWELHRLSRRDDGTWVTELQLDPGEYEYKFVVDGEWLEDPGQLQRVPNSFGTQNCVLRVNSIGS